jgi:hypothetical protein
VVAVWHCANQFPREDLVELDLAMHDSLHVGWVRDAHIVQAPSAESVFTRPAILKFLNYLSALDVSLHSFAGTGVYFLSKVV